MTLSIIKKMKFSEKALVFGLDSFTGNYMKNCLEKQNINVVGTSFDEKSSNYCNITDSNQCDHYISLHQPDYIINLAGISYVLHDNFQEIYNVNFNGALNIISSCEKYLSNSKILLISSAQIYSETKNSITEDCALSLDSHYSISKGMMEKAISLSKLNIKIARSFNYTGVGQSKNFLIPKLVDHYKRNKNVITLGDTSLYRDFMDVRDVVRAYTKILTSNSSEKVFNVCSSKAYCINEIIDFLNNEFNIKMKIINDEIFFRSGSYKYILGNNDKLKKIGWLAKHNIFDTIKWMIDD